MSRYVSHVIPIAVPLDSIEGTLEEPSYEMDVGTDIRSTIWFLSTPEVEVLVLSFMGYGSKEITEALGLQDIDWFYRLRMKLRRNARRILSVNGLK